MSLFRVRPRSIFLLLLIFLAVARPGYAQLEATTIENLAVDLWPDYDRPSVLVLLTGTLPDSTVLPVSVTIPLPPGATLNAVARITSENVMTDDVEYTQGEGSLTFVMPDNRFRVEYYMPYDAEGDQHTFEFDWLSDMTVTEMDVAVQQPAAAANMQTQPTAASITTNSNDGLTYHVLPITAVPAGQSYTVQVDYTMSEPTLTVEQLDTAETSSAPATAVNNDMNWPLLLAAVGGVLILVALVWQVASSRQKPKRPQKPTPQRTAVPPATPAPKTVQFCHECGSPVQPEDKFCRVCGTAVKNR